MRGKRCFGHQPRPGVRNIPAYAGKTWSNKALTMLWAEHPRVCGENQIPIFRRILIIGTSPRMRGKLLFYEFDKLIQRNIPAYAGKTTPDSKLGGYVSEHPRVCGENWLSVLAFIHAARNIPAYAGKTLHWTNSEIIISEHPRVCGENKWGQNQHQRYNGTSPRMRGKRGPHLHGGPAKRNIPAYAGKTPGRPRRV